MLYTIKENLLSGWLGGLLMLSALSAQAQTLIVVNVTVLASSCNINGGRSINVDFGDDVVTTQIDGKNYRQQVVYSLTCSGLSNNSLKLQIQGSTASFDNQLLQTSNDGLGIAIFSDNQRLSVNQWLSFTYPNIPVLEVIPMKLPGAKLKGGAFTAGATMKVDYP
jgi:type 1 fimbria pilin